MVQDRPILIEATSKKWKAYQLAGAGVILVGLVLLGLAISTKSTVLIHTSAVVPAIGVLVILVARTLAWWHHG